MLVLNENEPILTHLFVFRLMEVLYRFVKIKRGEMKHNTNFEESKVDVQNRVRKKKEQKQKIHIWLRTHQKGYIRGGWFRVDRWMLSFLRKPSIFPVRKKNMKDFCSSEELYVIIKNKRLVPKG